MNAIVAVTADWGIGRAGALLVHNTADLRFFAHKTCGHTVLMGRRTLESLPGGRPLTKRRNIVLTRNATFANTLADIECVHDIGAALELVASIEPADEVWLIGGGRIYRELLPYCQYAFVTYHAITVPADTFFPNLDADPAWQLTHQEAWNTTDDGIRFCHREYQRIV